MKLRVNGVRRSRMKVKERSVDVECDEIVMGRMMCVSACFPRRPPPLLLPSSLESSSSLLDRRGLVRYTSRVGKGVRTILAGSNLGGKRTG